LPEVEATCDRILILAHGRLRAQGTPTELLTLTAKPGYLVLPGRLTSKEQGDGFKAALGALPGVVSVQQDDTAGTGGLRVGPDNSAADLRESIAVAAAQQGVLLTELHMIRPSLEQVFMRVTQDGEGGAAA